MATFTPYLLSYSTNSFSHLTIRSMYTGSFVNSTTDSSYVHLWKKYRPAILQLMVTSAEAPQEYKFSGHEFKGINPKEKGGYSFTLQAFQGKAVNNIKNSIVAKGLLLTLQQSPKATELMNTEVYQFVLDKQFVLHVTKQEPIQEPTLEETPAE